MSDILELVRRAFAASDADDVDAFIALHAPDCRWLSPDGPLEGRDAVRAFIAPFHEAFPAGRHEIDRLYEPGGNTVVVEGRWTATHTGVMRTPGGDVPPTGRTVVVPFVVAIDGDETAGHIQR